MVLNPEESGLRQTDALSVVSGVAGTNADLTWEWMQENWDTLEEMYDTAVSAPIGRLGAETNSNHHHASLCFHVYDCSIGW